MPVYVYRCESCSNEFEKRQGFEVQPVTECPECGGRCERVIQPVNTIVKQAGWRREKQADGSAIYTK